MSWPKLNLESLAAKEPYSFVGGPFGSKLTTRDYVESGIPVIRGSNMNNGRYLDMTDFVFVTESKVREDLSSNLAKPGDLVFTQPGTLGQVAIIPSDGIADRYVVSQSQMKLTVDEAKADRLFLYYFFSSREATERIISFVSSSGVPHINLTVLRNFEVPIPPPENQRNIARVLTAYDDLIENNRRRIQLLEQAARLLYKEWFVHLRFPGHEHTQIIDGVPEGWEKKNILDVWDVRYGKNLPTKNITQSGKYPVHGAERVIGYFSQKNVDESLCLITCRGAGSGNVRRTFGPTFLTNNCFVLRPKYLPDNLRFHFAMLTMERLSLHELRTGAAQPQLTLAGINHLNVVIPSLTILGLYNSVVDPLYLQADCLRRQDIQLAKARDLLLPKLMNGEVAV